MRDEKATRKMAEDGQRGLHIQIIHIKINKPVKSLNNFIIIDLRHTYSIKNTQSKEKIFIHHELFKTTICYNIRKSFHDVRLV